MSTRINFVPEFPHSCPMDGAVSGVIADGNNMQFINESETIGFGKTETSMVRSDAREIIQNEIDNCSGPTEICIFGIRRSLCGITDATKRMPRRQPQQVHVPEPILFGNTVEALA